MSCHKSKLWSKAALRFKTHEGSRSSASGKHPRMHSSPLRSGLSSLPFTAVSSHVCIHGSDILQDLKKKEGSDGDGQAAEITDGSATKAGMNTCSGCWAHSMSTAPKGSELATPVPLLQCSVVQCSAPCTV